jgi:hypothetical protein
MGIFCDYNVINLTVRADLKKNDEEMVVKREREREREREPVNESTHMNTSSK